MERNYNKRHLPVVRRRPDREPATVSYALSTIGITQMDTRDEYNSSGYDSMLCCSAR